MRWAWHHFCRWLTPGVRLILGLLAASCLAAFIGTISSAYDLSALLGLSGPAFWHGRIWLGVTYVLVPSGILDFLFNGVMIAWLGSFLERAWSRRELWSYCLVVTLGGGLIKVVLQPFTLSPLIGATPLVFGLLAARIRLSGAEQGFLGSMPEAPARRIILLVAAITFLLMAASAGLLNAGVMLGGGLVGWVYLSCRWKFNRMRQGGPVTAERIARLEL